MFGKFKEFLGSFADDNLRDERDILTVDLSGQSKGKVKVFDDFFIKPAPFVEDAEDADRGFRGTSGFGGPPRGGLHH